eukprot:4571604-Pyramimonas_sp.AAC.1
MARSSHVGSIASDPIPTNASSITNVMAKHATVRQRRPAGVRRRATNVRQGDWENDARRNAPPCGAARPRRPTLPAVSPIIHPTSLLCDRARLGEHFKSVQISRYRIYVAVDEVLHRLQLLQRRHVPPAALSN